MKPLGGEYSRQASSSAYSQIGKKKRRKRRVIKTLVIVVLAVVLGGGALAYGYAGYINGKLGSGIGDRSALDSVLQTNLSSSDPFYMLLLGTDERDPDESGRSDTIILARVDTQNKQVILLSIPRDTRVYIEGHGYQKINAAHAFGGAAGAVDAVEKLTGVQISHYAEIDFSKFTGLVDALGGVEVNVPFEINDPDAGGHVSAGDQVLNGEQALIFCRTRATGYGDYQRQTNQRIFLQALASKVLASDPTTMLRAVNAISDAVSTDLDVNSIIDIANSLRGMSSDSIYSYTVPSASKVMDGVSYVIADEEELKTLMGIIDSGQIPPAQDESLTGVVPSEYDSAAAATAGGTTGSTTYTPDRSSYTITVRNGGGIAGSASSVAEDLSSLGYQIGETGNADSFDHDKTLVIYKNASDLPAVNDIISEIGCGTAQAANGQYSFDGQILVLVGSDYK